MLPFKHYEYTRDLFLTSWKNILSVINIAIKIEYGHMHELPTLDPKQYQRTYIHICITHA